MSPAVLISLPFALLLLMAQGAGANASTQTKDQTETSKVMGLMTEKGDFIPFPSLTNGDNINAYDDGILIEQYGKRYLLASSVEKGS